VPFFANKPELLAEILSRYPDDRKRSAIMPLLRTVQNAEQYISEERIVEIAAIIESTPTEVKSVMSFYSTYYDLPTGKYHLQVCMTLGCALYGANQLWDHLQNTLGITQGEVTDDGLFSLQRVECLGSCGTAPMLQVSDSGYYERLSRKRTDALLAELKRRGDGSLPDNDVAAPTFFVRQAGSVGQVAFDGRVALSDQHDAYGSSSDNGGKQ
jgi:NADH-quinone oxidoreductase subunit E